MACVLEHLHSQVLPSGPLIRPSVAAWASVGLTSGYVLSLYLSTSTRVGSKSAYYTTTVTQTVRTRRRRRTPKHAPADNSGSLAKNEPSQDDEAEYEEVEEEVVQEVRVPLDKNHPRVVAARIKVALSSTVAATAATFAFLNRYGSPNVITSSVLRIPICFTFLGLPLPLPSFLNSSVLPLRPSLGYLALNHYLPALTLPLALTTCLFTGPLFVDWLGGTLLPGQAGWSWSENVASKYNNIWGLRNYLVGPLTEEIVFRACILNLHHASGSSNTVKIFVTPLYFGVAHMHHAWETYVKGGRTRQALVRGVLQSVFQFGYTTLFGWYANFVFLRTNSILAPIICHSFCNMMGLPDIASALEEHPKRRTGENINGSHRTVFFEMAQLTSVTVPEPLPPPASHHRRVSARDRDLLGDALESDRTCIVLWLRILAVIRIKATAGVAAYVPPTFIGPGKEQPAARISSSVWLVASEVENGGGGSILL
ncbi:CAAX prenyl protease [Tilletia horrida]|nr:CAAX prenyl protease [Tilletia horrida]